MHLACRVGNETALKMITEVGGVNVNDKNAKGWTPLHEVAYNGNEVLLKQLFRLKADANIIDNVSFLVILSQKESEISHNLN